MARSSGFWSGGSVVALIERLAFIPKSLAVKARSTWLYRDFFVEPLQLARQPPSGNCSRSVVQPLASHCSAKTCSVQYRCTVRLKTRVNWGLSSC